MGCTIDITFNMYLRASPSAIDKPKMWE